MHTATDEFRALHAAMEASCTRFALIATLPLALTEGAHAASLVSELLASIEERRSFASDQLTAIRNLHRLLDDANKSNRDAQARLNAVTQLRDGERASLHDAQLEVVSASEEAKQAGQKLTEIEVALSPFLAAADVGGIIVQFQLLTNIVDILRCNLPTNTGILNGIDKRV